MNIISRARALAAAAIVTLSAGAVEIGPETPVTGTTGVRQQNVVISRDSTRTLITFEESAGEGQPAKVVLHQYEVAIGGPLGPLGRETFALQAASRDQRRPELGNHMVAWVEQDPGGGAAELWWESLLGYELGTSYRPQLPARREESVAPGTPIAILHRHVFHVILWTAPDGRLKAVEHSLLARIGYDPTPWYVTEEQAVNPAVSSWHRESHVIAYNHPVAGSGNAVRATALLGRTPQPSIVIAPSGASAPRVISLGQDFLVFWSLDDGATYAQRVSAGGGAVAKIGDARRIADGTLHDASSGPGDDSFLVVERGDRFALLRLDEELNVVEEDGFAAQLPAGERVSLSSHSRATAMLAYSAAREDGTSQAVFRVVGDNVASRKRRSVR